MNSNTMIRLVELQDEVVSHSLPIRKYLGNALKTICRIVGRSR